ncbi:biotin--[acetyl-CoA-carboxylase] ligase [uncultured Polaribacter sp.]|uniref:biotin--[acetyl-CoA-carboxylase] ligase n=1 Tax=uncultured Polaribacter sp. TaxID=174711 RepID=UPI002609EA42|nr:biotin--[acetyl-CoA-carboxylase] ligase [uncultured Polaribacter sp.]
MKIIKLNATDSTNSFLKKLEKNMTLENFTVIVTDMQLKGKGQQDSVWLSEPYKNLTFSVLIYFSDLLLRNANFLNFAISAAIFDVLEKENIPNLKIKWPNDILSANQKICGVLLENNFKGVKIRSSVVGIGLNVNQTGFSKKLNKVSSLKLIANKEFNLDLLLHKLIKKIQENITLLNAKRFKLLENKYMNNLYKKNTATMFKDSNNVVFMGIIVGVSHSGKLQIELENGMIKEYGIKEIAFL